MRVETQQVFQVSLQLCEFLNVNLNDRGYYHIRVTPKKTPEMASVLIVTDEDDRKKFILNSHVTKGVGVSKTVEVSYQHEAFSIEDWFTIAVTFQPNSKLCQIRKLEIDIELFYQTRYSAPQYETFEKYGSRTIQIPMDPSRFTAAARSLYFESSVCSALTLTVFSSLVTIEAVPEKLKIVESSANKTSDKLRRLFTTALHVLVPTAKSVQQFIIRNRHLITTSVSADEIDVQKEIQTSLQKFDMAGSIARLMVEEIMQWNGRVTLITQQMHVLFKQSKALTAELLLEYDKQRRAVFREAFWFNERSMDEITIRTPFLVNEALKSINKTQYLKKLPRITLYCEETDCPGERCPVIFEDKYSRNPHGVHMTDGEKNPLQTSSTMPVLKANEKQHKSFRERFRKGLLGNRRKSLESSQSTSRKGLRNRTQTSGGLISQVQSQGEDELKSKTSLPTPTLESRAESRCSAAGESSEEWKTAREVESMVSKESVTSSEIQRAIRPSVSADDVLAVNPECAPTTSTQPIIKQLPEIQNPAEENPLELMAAYELLKGREAAKKMLREEARYEGILYSEKSGKSVDGPVFTPLTSEFVDGKPVGDYCSRIHLVVYVHGLDGSHEDLQTFRFGLEQSVAAAYQSADEKLGEMLADPTAALQALKSDDKYTGPWKFEHLMSSANSKETWAEFKVMGTNLVNEIIDQIDNRTNVERISFITHSLGGLIVRQAIALLADLQMDWIAERCHTLMTINSPHLGVVYVAKHIHWGCQFVKWFKKSQSMQQLTFRDTDDFATSTLYKLAHGNECGSFKHVLFIGSPNDQMVPYMSSLLMHSKATIEDTSRFGEIYRQMMNAMLNSMRNSSKTETVVRYTAFHQLEAGPMHKLSGRADHVMVLEDEAFIEKLFNISAVKYFV